MFHQTPFVRHNTPHPRELKAKAHKLFAKRENSMEDSEQHSTTDVSVPQVTVEAVNPHVRYSSEEPQVSKTFFFYQEWYILTE